MNPRFNPLLQSTEKTPAAHKPFKLKIVPAEKVDQPFKPLSSAMAAVKPGSSRGTGRSSDAHEHEPKLDVQRDGEKITRIVVICGCGSVMEVDCDYSSAPTS